MSIRGFSVASVVAALAVGVALWSFEARREGHALDPSSRDRPERDREAEDREEGLALPFQRAPAPARAPVETDEATTDEATENAQQSSVGAIAGRLETSEGAPVDRGIVLLNGATRAGVDAVGRFSFSDLAPGEYRLTVDEESLPPGLQPPYEQDQSVPYERESMPPGYYATDVEVSEGRRTEVVLVVHGKGTVDGVVLGPEQEGVADVEVRLHGTDPDYILPNVIWYELSGHDGRFAIENVIPGRYWLVVYYGQKHPYHGIGQPRPLDVYVRDGGSSFVTVTLGGGDRTISGRIVDQDGDPFPGIGILCYYGGWGEPAGMTESDEEGRFSFYGLLPAQLGLQFGVNEFSSSQEIGDPARRLTKWGPNLRVDLFEQVHADVGTITIEESRPFIVEGRITGYPTPSRLHLEYVTSSGEEGVSKVSKSGEYRFGVDTPLDALVLFVLSPRRERLFTTTLYPAPSEREELDISLE